jgi:hypothetical protein
MQRLIVGFVIPGVLSASSGNVVSVVFKIFFI